LTTLFRIERIKQVGPFLQGC